MNRAMTYRTAHLNYWFINACTYIVELVHPTHPLKSMKPAKDCVAWHAPYEHTYLGINGIEFYGGGGEKGLTPHLYIQIERSNVNELSFRTTKTRPPGQTPV